MIVFGVLLAYVVALMATAYSDPSQSDVDEFIDLCNLFADTMAHCATGWVELEQEMMTSMESFSQRILVTEQLIGGEADQILVMASLVVETEEMMTDVLDACKCETGYEGYITHDSTQKKIRVQRVPLPLHGSVPERVIPTVNTSALTSLLADVDVDGDHCAPMDEFIEVMEEALATFVTINDDFLDVLTYMDMAINDMGDRIVATECLVVNMSYLIGDMADQIVVVEGLMFSATENCCHGRDIHSNHGPAVHRTTLTPMTLVDDDIAECDDFLSVPDLARYGSTQQALVEKDKAAMEKMQTVAATLFKSTHPNARFIKKLATSGSRRLDTPMPCDTWWNPFCCAMEMCADMMIAMMKAMQEGSDAMEVMVKTAVDEIGSLADDIILTEEEIVLMGCRIVDMSDCMVEVIDDSIQFAEEFCPSGGSPLRTLSSTDDACSSSLTATYTHPESAKNVSAKKRTAREGASRRALKAVQDLASTRKQALTVEWGDGPTDFTAMIDAMIACASAAESMIIDQLNTMTLLIGDLNDVSTKQSAFMQTTQSMDDDLTALGIEIVAMDELGDELTSCGQ